MKGYSEKFVNPLYKTSNSDYGGKRPNVHTMPTAYFSKSAGFTEVNFKKKHKTFFFVYLRHLK